MRPVRRGLADMQSDRVQPDFTPRPLDYIEFLTWVTSRVTLGGGAFTFVSVFDGPLDELKVLQAWSMLCRRHPMLGATVDETSSRPTFVPLAEFPVPQIRTTSSRSVVEELLASIGEVEFPPGAPLYQPFALLNPQTGRHAFITVINHAAGDGDACLKLHKEFAEALAQVHGGSRDEPSVNRTLPPSWCETLAPEQGPWRFLRSGAVQLSRGLFCDLVPFETRAPFSGRRTRHLIAIADVASTEAVVRRASEHHGFAAFLSASLLQTQFSHMSERGLVGKRANLVLTLPTNLRRFAAPGSAISMGTFPNFASVAVEKDLSSVAASARVREAIDRFAKPDARDNIVSWFNPFLARGGIRRLANSNMHFGPYTTHLGRLELATEGNLRRVSSFGYLQMRHCFSSVQASTRLLDGRFVASLNYCEPIVSRKTAEAIFREFLHRVGVGKFELTDDYDEYVEKIAKRTATPIN